MCAQVHPAGCPQAVELLQRIPAETSSMCFLQPAFTSIKQPRVLSMPDVTYCKSQEKKVGASRSLHQPRIFPIVHVCGLRLILRIYGHQYIRVRGQKARKFAKTTQSFKCEQLEQSSFAAARHL
jgi:hypothetical protein